MMMDWTAEHAGFVAAAYGCVALVLGGAALAIVHRAQKLKRELSALNLPDVGQPDGQQDAP